MFEWILARRLARADFRNDRHRTSLPESDELAGAEVHVFRPTIGDQIEAGETGMPGSAIAFRPVDRAFGVGPPDEPRELGVTRAGDECSR